MILFVILIIPLGLYFLLQYLSLDSFKYHQKAKGIRYAILSYMIFGIILIIAFIYLEFYNPYQSDFFLTLFYASGFYISFSSVLFFLYDRLKSFEIDERINRFFSVHSKLCILNLFALFMPIYLTKTYYVHLNETFWHPMFIVSLWFISPGINIFIFIILGFLFQFFSLILLREIRRLKLSIILGIIGYIPQMLIIIGLSASYFIYLDLIPSIGFFLFTITSILFIYNAFQWWKEDKNLTVEYRSKKRKMTEKDDGLDLMRDKLEINYRDRLYEWIQAKNEINLTDAAVVLEVGPDDIEALLYDLAAENKLKGTFSENIFIIESDMDEFLESLEQAFHKWGQAREKLT